jgi:aspartate aminotransferase
MAPFREGTMDSPLAARLARLGAEGGFEVLARARALEAKGRKILHLQLGEPDFPTPQHVVDAGANALREGWTRYGPAAGLMDFRQAVADHVGASRGVPVAAEEVVVGPGAKPLIFYAIVALVDPGDEVLCPDPAYPTYESVTRLVGGVPVPYGLPESRAFAPDPAEIAARITPRTKLVVLNSPGNPCGGVTSREDLEALAEALRPTRAWVLSDEIYGEILYGGRHASILSVPGMKERTVLVDGFSKCWSMTGWRLGYGVLPVPVAQAVTRLQVNAVSCPSPSVQRAGLAALQGPRTFVDTMVAEFRARRDAFVADLNTVKGFRCLPPKGAFYAWVNVEGTGRNGKEIADLLLAEAGVACVSGASFGAPGDRYIRFSFATSREILGAAVAAMRSVLGAA